jgi:hypothetical protein
MQVVHSRPPRSQSPKGTAQRLEAPFQFEHRRRLLHPLFRPIRNRSHNRSSNRHEVVTAFGGVHSLRPIRGLRDWPWRQFDPLVSPRAIPITRPTPILCARDDSGPNGIAFDITAHRQEVAIRLNRKRFEPALVNTTRAQSAMVRVPALAVCRCEPLHEPREFTIDPRPGDKVKVVWHDAVGQNPQGNPALSVAQGTHER